jgi:hypothetical protein
MSDKIRKLENGDEEGVPFRSGEDAWFWFMAAYQAKSEGARITAGQGIVPRPCEPLDILKVVDRLHRNRVLILDHVLVLRHYGQRFLRPDGARVREMRAAQLWREAIGHLESILIDKGIVARAPWWRGVAETAMKQADRSCHVA